MDSLSLLARGVVADLADLVLPRSCVGCGDPGTSLCPACSTPLSAAPRRCDPVPAPAGLPPCHSVADYADSVRDALIAHKERGEWSLTRPLGEALAQAVSHAAAAGQGSGPVVLVPVPSSRAAVMARGDDTVLLLARAATAALRRSGTAAVTCALLRQRRGRQDQSGLDAARRAANLHRAFAATRSARTGRWLGSGGMVVVVDDLVTTGSTVVEAARALAEAGVDVAAAATVAATRRRGTRPPPACA